MNKTVIITGAAKGIGRAIAKDFAYSGYNVCINYNTSENEAKELCSELAKNGCNVIIYKADITKREEVDKMVEYVIGTFGNIDVLVNNAGITRDNLLMRMKESEWDDVIDTNLKGVFNCIQKVTPQMLRQKSGSIINLSSVVGAVGNPGQANYVATKAGVIGLTKSAAKELASRNITVNAVAPGFIVSDMTDALS